MMAGLSQQAYDMAVPMVAPAPPTAPAPTPAPAPTAALRGA